MGIEVHLVVLNLDGAVYHEALDAHVCLSSLDVRHTRWAIGKLWRYVREERPDVVLVFDHELAIVLVFLRMIGLLRCTIVARTVTMLSNHRETNGGSFWYKHVVGYMVRRFYGWVDHIIAQSQGMAVDLIEKYGISPSMVTIIRNPVAPQIESAAQSYQIEEPPLWDILFVGRLAKEKGLDSLLSAFAQCLAQMPHLQLCIVGNGPLEAQVYKRAQALGIGHAVKFEGFVEDIAQYYRRSRLVALTSLYEGFPNVLIEALTFGVPVVAFDCPSGPREIIMDGVNGFLVPLRDEALFAEKLKEALRMKWDRKTIKNTAKKYTVETISRQYYDLIMGLQPTTIKDWQ